MNRKCPISSGRTQPPSKPEPTQTFPAMVFVLYQFYNDGQGQASIFSADGWLFSSPELDPAHSALHFFSFFPD